MLGSTLQQTYSKLTLRCILGLCLFPLTTEIIVSRISELGPSTQMKLLLCEDTPLAM